MEGSQSVEQRLAQDPLGLVHDYADPLDQEIVALCAAQLAYGRVDLFRPILSGLFAHMDTFGSPRAYVMGFDGAAEAPILEHFSYRWTKGCDWQVFLCALRAMLEKHGSLKSAFESAWEEEQHIDAVLNRVVGEMADFALGFSDGKLSRGSRYFFSMPAGGSACKRWALFLRWMVRSPEKGIDLGLFALPSESLMMPLDTHVHRISRMIGLTRRKDTSWKTASEVTKALAKLDPVDPTRFDFALAHLGISNKCSGVQGMPVCEECAIQAFCTAPYKKTKKRPVKRA